MRAAYAVILGVGLFFFFADIRNYAEPGLLNLLFAVLSFFSIVASVVISSIFGFTKWRKSSRLWMLPPVVSLAFILGGWLTAPAIGRSLADREFEQHIGEYTAVVNAVKNGTIVCGHPCSSTLDVIELKERPFHTGALKVGRCQDGTVVVAFRRDTDVPLLHEGYVYSDLQDGHSCITSEMKPESNFPYVRPVLGNWYHFSDQPGL